MIWLVVFAAWPLLVTGAFLYFRRHRLARKGRFAATSLAVAYPVQAAMAWAATEGLPRAMAAINPTAYLVFLSIIGIAVITPYVFSLLAMWAVSRRFTRALPSGSP